MGRSKNTAETLYQGTYGEGTWVCPNDETLNTGEACVICGCKRPKAKKRRWIVWAVATLTVMCFALMNYARCEIFGHNWQFATAWEPETCSVCGATRGEIDKWARAYEDAAALEAAGDMPSAAIAFGKLGWYRDARDRSFRLWHEIIKYNSIADEKELP